MVARVERGEGLVEVDLVLVLEPHARLEALRLEVAAHVAQQGKRLVALAAAVQGLGERDGGVGATRLELERAAQ